MKRLAIIAALALSGCATVDVTQTDVAKTTHKDLTAAAARATSAGYPDRAQVYLALDNLITAREMQINECNKAIAAALPQPSAQQFAGAFDALEAAAEAVDTFSGIPASVKLHCAAIPLPALPVLPKP